MASKYHRDIVKIIKKFGKQHEDIKQIRTVSTGKIVIAHLDNPFVKDLTYIPDVRFLRDKDLRNITFQVLDSQATSNKKILGDILNAILTGYVEIAYFIVPDEATFKKVTSMMRLVENIFEKIIKAPKKNLPRLKVKLIPKDLRGVTIRDKEYDYNKSEKLQLFLEESVNANLEVMLKGDKWFN